MAVTTYIGPPKSDYCYSVIGNLARANLVDHDLPVHPHLNRSLINVVDMVWIPVRIDENWANVSEEINCLAFHLAWVMLCLVGHHAMHELMLLHEAGDQHLDSMLRLAL